MVDEDKMINIKLLLLSDPPPEVIYQGVVVPRESAE